MKNIPLDDILNEVKSAMGSFREDMDGIKENFQGMDFGPGEGGEPGEEIEKEFEVRTPASLVVSNVSGSVTITAAPGDRIHVSAHKHGSPRAVESTRIAVTQSGSRVEARTSSDQVSRFNLGRNMCSVDYEITVPPECEVQVKTVSADVSVEGTSLRGEVQTVSGDVTLNGMDAGCAVTSVSGDISGEGLGGELTLRTTSGDAEVRGSNFRTFSLNSVSGDLTLETPLERSAHYMAKTVSGDLELVVPADTAATIQLKSISGSTVVSDLPAEVIKAGPRRWQGRINGGGANVEMNSVSGDLRVCCSPAPPRTDAVAAVNPVQPSVPLTPSVEPIPSVPPVPPEAPNSVETMNVLAALERGEINVEEALAKLEPRR